MPDTDLTVDEFRKQEKAYEAGLQIGLSGLPETDNPHDASVRDREYDAWKSGWDRGVELAAEREDE